MNSVQNIIEISKNVPNELIELAEKRLLELDLSPAVVKEVSHTVTTGMTYLYQQNCLLGILRGRLVPGPIGFEATLTAFYAALLARKLEWVNPSWMKTLIAGALLSNIGQEGISSGLKDPQHPIRGVSKLDGVGFFNEGVKQIILQHHETADGRGYPFGLEGKYIYPLARIVSLSEALMEQQLYGIPWRPQHFDPELIHVWEMSRVHS